MRKVLKTFAPGLQENETQTIQGQGTRPLRGLGQRPKVLSLSKNGTQMAKKTEDVRQQAFNSLPPAIRATLTEEEKRIFLTEEHWPESLCSKLSEFLYPLDPDTDCDEIPR